MPLCFQSRSHSSYDTVSGISIPRPRILPTDVANGKGGTEYQYSFYRGDHRIGGLGFEGHDEVVVDGAFREWVFTLDLGHDWLVSSMVEFKQALGDTDDDFTFVRSLANGLVMAYAGQVDNEDNLRYVAITTSAALAQGGVEIPDGTDVAADGVIVLAQVVVPACWLRPGKTPAGPVARTCAGCQYDSQTSCDNHPWRGGFGVEHGAVSPELKKTKEE
jgi:hypothetical protein